MKIFAIIILSIISLTLSISFLDIFAVGHFSFNPIILLLYFVTLYWNGLYGLYLGFSIGVIYGTFFSIPFGFYSLIFSSLTFGLIIIRRKIYKYKYRSLIFLFITSFLARFLELIIHSPGTKLFFLYLVTNVIPESIITTIIGVGILYLIKRAI